jgi:hypothetical protein
MRQQQLAQRNRTLVASIDPGQGLFSNTAPPYPYPYPYPSSSQLRPYARAAASREVGNSPPNLFDKWTPLSSNPPPQQSQVASNQEVTADPDLTTTDPDRTTELKNLLNDSNLTELLNTTIPNQPGDSNYTIRSYLQAKLQSKDDEGWLAPITPEKAIDFLNLALQTKHTPADLATALQQGGVAGGINYLNSLKNPSPAPPPPVTPISIAESTPDKGVSVASASPPDSARTASSTTPASSTLPPMNLPPMRNADPSGSFA